MKRKTKIILFSVAGIFLLLFIAVIYFIQRPSTAALRTVTAVRQPVVQDVVFNGRVVAQRSAELAFEAGGTLVDVPVAVGEYVRAGQLLAIIDQRGSKLQVEKAQADKLAGRENAYLTWQKLEAEKVAKEAENKTTVEKAKQAVRDAKKELDQSQVIWDRTVRESGEEASTTDVRYLAVISARSAHAAAQKALEQTEAVVNTNNTSTTQAASVARANYVATQQAASGSKGPSSLQALENIANLSLSKNVLVAPFAGVVTAKSLEVGELASVGEVVVMVETIDQLEFVAQVPETDSVKLSVGMEATITFDAYTNKESLVAHVTKIAPAAKLIEGVPTFEVTLRTVSVDSDLKPGLTANVTVHAANVQNAVAIPRRALIRSNNRQFVKIQDADGAIREQDVVVGLVGSDGSVEIKQGLQGGETLVIPQAT